MNTQKGNTVAWFALVIAVIALIIGWMAFNRTGTDLEERIEMAVEEAIVNVSDDLERVEDQAEEQAAETAQEAADELQQEAQD